MDGNGDCGPARHEYALSASVLVLNRNYAAIRVVPARRAFILLFKNCAEAIETIEDTFGTYDFPSWIDFSEIRRLQPVGHDEFVRTPRYLILVPRVIRLVAYDKVPRRDVRFSRRNVLARDEHRCQYCGRRFSLSQLSLDHVVPRSRGGRSTWTNVVAACTPCNTRKGGRLPAEASMNLRRLPQPPKRNPALVQKAGAVQYGLWRHFLRNGDVAVDA